jgi:hypothetical protein
MARVPSRKDETMSYYAPDTWVVIFMNSDDPHYRVLGGWSGGYLSGDSWRFNSGITKVIEEDDRFLFIGTSGSTYACHKDMYGLRMSTAGIWNQLQEKFGNKVQMMDEGTNWLEMDWIVK